MSRNILNLPYSFGTTFNEVLKAIENTLSSIDLLLPYLENILDIDTVIGSDLDNLGTFLRILRYPNQSDEDYRTRLKGWLDSPEIKPSVQSIIGLAETLIGITPTIHEYPEFDFTSQIGKSHPGIWVGFTSAEIVTYGDLINEFILQAQNFKAAGIPLFWGVFEENAETISNIIDNPDADIHFIVGFSEEYNNAEALRIGSGTVGPTGQVGYVVSKSYIIDEFFGPVPSFRDFITDIDETFIPMLSLPTFEDTVTTPDDSDLSFIASWSETLAFAEIDEAYELVIIDTVQEEDPFTGTSGETIAISIPLTVGGGTVGPDPGDEGRVGTGGILVDIEVDYD
jgi:hypothetical protein